MCVLKYITFTNVYLSYFTFREDELHLLQSFIYNLVLNFQNGTCQFLSVYVDYISGALCILHSKAVEGWGKVNIRFPENSGCSMLCFAFLHKLYLISSIHWRNNSTIYFFFFFKVSSSKVNTLMTQGLYFYYPLSFTHMETLVHFDAVLKNSSLGYKRYQTLQLSHLC